MLTFTCARQYLLTLQALFVSQARQLITVREGERMVGCAYMLTFTYARHRITIHAKYSYYNTFKKCSIGPMQMNLLYVSNNMSTVLNGVIA